MSMRRQLGVLWSALVLTSALLAAMASGASAADQTPASLKAAVADNDYREIVNLAYSGQCIDVPHSERNERLRIATCNGSDTQKWGRVGAGAPDTYYLVNNESGFCVEVNDGTNVPGEWVDQYDCLGTQAERWVVTYHDWNGVRYEQYRHEGTSLCLDTVGGRGSELMQWNCDYDNAAQIWRRLR